MTTYTEQLLKLWHDLDHDPYIEVWEDGFDQPFIEYNPLSTLRTRLNAVEGFLHWNVALRTGSFISELCVDRSIEPAELHNPNLAALHAEFIALADIFTTSS